MDSKDFFISDFFSGTQSYVFIHWHNQILQNFQSAGSANAFKGKPTADPTMIPYHEHFQTPPLKQKTLAISTITRVFYCGPTWT